MKYTLSDAADKAAQVKLNKRVIEEYYLWQKISLYVHHSYKSEHKYFIAALS